MVACRRNSDRIDIYRFAWNRNTSPTITNTRDISKTMALTKEWLGHNNVIVNGLREIAFTLRQSHRYGKRDVVWTVYLQCSPSQTRFPRVNTRWSWKILRWVINSKQLQIRFSKVLCAVDYKLRTPTFPLLPFRVFCSRLPPQLRAHQHLPAFVKSKYTTYKQKSKWAHSTTLKESHARRSDEHSKATRGTIIAIVQLQSKS